MSVLMILVIAAMPSACVILARRRSKRYFTQRVRGRLSRRGLRSAGHESCVARCRAVIADACIYQRVMGVFVLTYSIGNIIAGLLSGNFDPENVAEMPNLYLQIALFSIAIGIVIALLSLKSRFWEKAGVESKA